MAPGETLLDWRGRPDRRWSRCRRAARWRRFEVAAQVEAARSELASREQTLGAAQADHRHYALLADYSRITAPFDGIVTWRYADAGSLL